MATKRKTAKKSAKKTAPKRAPAAKKAAPKKNVSAENRDAKAALKKLAERAKADVPSLFRINIEVGNLDEADRFYSELLGQKGRRQAGSRVYFSAGPVTLQVVDVSSMGMGVPHPAAKALYFLVRDLDAVFKRAEALGCLSKEMVHGMRGGAIAVRPWGERSFYAEDKWLNPLCFVEEGTTYPG
jgi:catechol 2,3-dioxygenase-like lactoylglutathione lyase family enzyme